MDRFSISREKDWPARTGHVPFGFDCANQRLVENEAEQSVVQRMRDYNTGGLSLRAIAGILNLKQAARRLAGQQVEANTCPGMRDCISPYQRTLVWFAGRPSADRTHTRRNVRVAALCWEDPLLGPPARPDQSSRAADGLLPFKPLIRELERPAVLRDGPNQGVGSAGRQLRLYLQRHGDLRAGLYREVRYDLLCNTPGVSTNPFAVQRHRTVEALRKLMSGRCRRRGWGRRFGDKDRGARPKSLQTHLD